MFFSKIGLHVLVIFLKLDILEGMDGITVLDEMQGVEGCCTIMINDNWPENSWKVMALHVYWRMFSKQKQ